MFEERVVAGEGRWGSGIRQKGGLELMCSKTRGNLRASLNYHLEHTLLHILLVRKVKVRKQNQDPEAQRGVTDPL